MDIATKILFYVARIFILPKLIAFSAAFFLILDVSYSTFNFKYQLLL